MPPSSLLSTIRDACIIGLCLVLIGGAVAEALATRAPPLRPTLACQVPGPVA